jgi:hypothetical protein
MGGYVMLVQVVIMTDTDGCETKYVDWVGTEDAADSLYALNEWRSDGEHGTLKVYRLVEV